MSSEYPVFAPQPEPGHRDWYAFEAIRSLPRLIMMADKNQYSPTYGSFDRSYWHYRTMDFPCGMNQEYVLPLALAYKMDLPHNRYRGNARLRELALAGIDYAAKSSYKDGTTDDYFPYERAMGALVFSLYAMTEVCLELGEKDPRHLEFFTRRGVWLLNHNETGKLANHQAFAALALYNVFLLTGDKRFQDGSNHFRDLTLSWRNPEGWFQEYEGADPGYHTCTIGFFGKLWKKTKDEKIFQALLSAVDFAHNFMHPDGSYGGEYGSRNTFHFYPHGFELMAPFSAKAGQIADTFLHRSMPMRKRYYNDDDRMAAHYVYDWMHAWHDYAPQRTGPIAAPAATEAKWYPNAKMQIVKTPSYHFVANAMKGGAFKAVSESGMFAGDTALIGELEDGRVVVTHIIAANEAAVSEDARKLTISGVFQKRKSMLPTPFKQVLFRLFMLTVGRFNANAVRSTLQKILIVGKAPLAITFRREIIAEDNQLTIIDEIEKPHDIKFARLSCGTDATSMYVANSNVFQESVLTPWRHFTADEIAELNRTNKVRKVQTFTPP
ncbi:hypothetical protein BH09SUM1_BH09SUM1_20070 [soil metagenome]